MKRITKRTIVLLGVVAAAVALSVGAYAYWTTSGSGTGSATTGTNTAVTVTQVGTVSALVPGGAAPSVRPWTSTVVPSVGSVREVPQALGWTTNTFHAATAKGRRH